MNVDRDKIDDALNLLYDIRNKAEDILDLLEEISDMRNELTEKYTEVLDLGEYISEDWEGHYEDIMNEESTLYNAANDIINAAEYLEGGIHDGVKELEDAE